MTRPIAEITCRLQRPRALATWAFDRLFDRLLDKRFGINSSRRLSLSSLGLEAPDRAGYQAISYLDFPFLIEGVEPRGTFIDFGAGAGRCVCLASRHAFQAVIGVELSEMLCTMARHNIEARKINNARIECGDATAFAIPPEATTFAFFNPFRGQIMRAVLGNIMWSVENRPRRVTVLACGSPVDPEFFEPLQTTAGLQMVRQIVLPTGCVGMVFENSSFKSPSAPQPPSPIS
jgi:hypothetical protein